MAPRGRPRSFDRTSALNAMMEVFWSRGYEGAQLVELTAAAGIAPPSFYAAFGSKESAFCEAVDHYIATIGVVPMRALEQALNLREGLRSMLLASIEVAVSREPGGCFLVLGVVNCLPENQEARSRLMQARQKTRDHIVARIERGCADGELATGSDTAQLAAFFHAMMLSISFQARDGASRQDLVSLIEPALCALKLVAESKV